MEGIKYETVEGGELFKWDKVGNKIEGVLVNYESRPDTGKGLGHIYEVKTKNGTISFFAPSILHKKLRDVAIPSVVNIHYIKEDKTKVGNTLKMFEVGYAPATEANAKLVGVELMKKVADDNGFGDFPVK
jgi:hypothetical protein